jgi:site-specific DNA-methyltransferase (adenine-specific)
MFMTDKRCAGEYVDSFVSITNQDVSQLYSDWEAPTAIISDGAYGTGSFPTDPDTPEELASWYTPHVKSWSDRATAETTLWFWNTEIGWAEVHPVLRQHGWKYKGANIWNKGIQHIAGNSNTQKLRRFPATTELCVQYVYTPSFTDDDGGELMSLQEWIIQEWERAGLTRQEANKACGVADAASRKYLTTGQCWYYPPPDRMEELVEYANKHGDDHGAPYFAPDGEVPITREEYRQYRAKFDCPSGVTNVWEHPQVTAGERIQEAEGTMKSLHSNQKPARLMKRIIAAATDPGDVVWEPFGGLCTGMVAAKELGRNGVAAEVVDEYFSVAVDRVRECSGGSDSFDTGNAVVPVSKVQKAQRVIESAAAQLDGVTQSQENALHRITETIVDGVSEASLSDSSGQQKGLDEWR